MYPFIILAAIVVVANGGVAFEDAQGQLASETQIRDCRAAAEQHPQAPTAADSFRSNDAMHESAMKHQELVAQCMQERGFKRKA